MGEREGMLTGWHHHRPVVDRSGSARARERGVTLVEFALVVIPLVFVVFGAIDLGRMSQYQNRVTNAAREGAAILQAHPGWVEKISGTSTSCDGGRNAKDNAKRQNADLAAMPSFEVKVYRGTGPFTAANELTGCKDGFPTGVTVGSKLTVVVKVEVATSSPLTSQFLGDKATIRRSATVVVQG